MKGVERVVGRGVGCGRGGQPGGAVWGWAGGGGGAGGGHTLSLACVPLTLPPTRLPALPQVHQVRHALAQSPRPACGCVRGAVGVGVGASCTALDCDGSVSSRTLPLGPLLCVTPDTGALLLLPLFHHWCSLLLGCS